MSALSILELPDELLAEILGSAIILRLVCSRFRRIIDAVLTVSICSSSMISSLNEGRCSREQCILLFERCPFVALYFRNCCTQTMTLLGPVLRHVRDLTVDINHRVEPSFFSDIFSALANGMKRLVIHVLPLSSGAFGDVSARLSSIWETFIDQNAPTLQHLEEVGLFRAAPMRFLRPLRQCSQLQTLKHTLQETDIDMPAAAIECLVDTYAALPCLTELDVSWFHTPNICTRLFSTVLCRPGSRLRSLRGVAMEHLRSLFDFTETSPDRSQQQQQQQQPVYYNVAEIAFVALDWREHIPALARLFPNLAVIDDTAAVDRRRAAPYTDSTTTGQLLQLLPRLHSLRTVVPSPFSDTPNLFALPVADRARMLSMLPAVPVPIDVFLGKQPAPFHHLHDGATVAAVPAGTRVLRLEPYPHALVDFTPLCTARSLVPASLGDSLREFHFTFCHVDDRPTIAAFEELLNWLAQLPRLETLRLQLATVRSEPEALVAACRAVRFPSLRTLELSLDDRLPCAMTAVAAMFPTLQNLQLGFIAGVRDVPIAVLRAFQLQCPQLRVVDLRVTVHTAEPVSVADFAAWICSLPCVREVYVRRPDLFPYVRDYTNHMADITEKLLPAMQRLHRCYLAGLPMKELAAAAWWCDFRL